MVYNAFRHWSPLSPDFAILCDRGALSGWHGSQAPNEEDSQFCYVSTPIEVRCKYTTLQYTGIAGYWTIDNAPLWLSPFTSKFWWKPRAIDWTTLWIFFQCRLEIYIGKKTELTFFTQSHQVSGRWLASLNGAIICVLIYPMKLQICARNQRVYHEFRSAIDFTNRKICEVNVPLGAWCEECCGWAQEAVCLQMGWQCRVAR